MQTTRSDLLPTLAEWSDRNLARKSVHMLLTKWANFAKKQSEMHDMAWAWYRFWNITSSVTSMIIVCISGIVSITFGQHDTCNMTSAPIIIAGSMTLIGSTIMAMNKLMGLGEIQQQHDIFSDSFEIIYNDIAVNMTISNSSHRVFANDYELIKFLNFKIDQLIDRSPTISNTIREKHLQRKHSFIVRPRKSNDLSSSLARSREVRDVLYSIGSNVDRDSPQPQPQPQMMTLQRNQPSNQQNLPVVFPVSRPPPIRIQHTTHMTHTTNESGDGPKTGESSTITPPSDSGITKYDNNIYCISESQRSTPNPLPPNQQLNPAPSS